MNNSMYQELFPLLNYDNTDEYENDCRFFFPDDPSHCIHYVRNKKKEWYKNSDFALQQCLKEDNVSIKNCKKYAGTNDIAFQICMSNVKQSSSSNNYVTVLVVVIIFLILLLAVIFFVLYGKK